MRALTCPQGLCSKCDSLIGEFSLLLDQLNITKLDVHDELYMASPILGDNEEGIVCGWCHEGFYCELETQKPNQ